MKLARELSKTVSVDQKRNNGVFPAVNTNIKMCFFLFLTPPAHPNTTQKLILTLNLNPSFHLRDGFDLVRFTPREKKKRVSALP